MSRCGLAWIPRLQLSLLWSQIPGADWRCQLEIQERVVVEGTPAWPSHVRQQELSGHTAGSRSPWRKETVQPCRRASVCGLQCP